MKTSIDAKTGGRADGTIRARVRRGVLEPLEKLDLPEGTDVTLTILTRETTPDDETFRRAAGGWKGTLDAEKLIRAIYAARRVATRPVPRL